MSTILNVCCLSSKYFQNSFSDIARVLSEFFRDLDVVPSDVVVGLVLLRQRQQLMRLRVIHQVHFFAVFPSIPLVFKYSMAFLDLLKLVI